MRFLIFLCGLAIAAGSERWDNFKRAHGKSYGSLEEELYRKSIFEENEVYVEHHNQRFREGLVTFDLQMNKFGDLTVDEFASLMTRRVKKSKVKKSFVIFPDISRDDHVDWREKGAVTPVKDQGVTQESWTFSAVGSLESIWFLKTGNLTDESEQQLVDCMHLVPGQSSASLVEMAYEYIKDNGGIDSEEAYHYQGGECAFDPKGVAATITGYLKIPLGDEESLAKSVRYAGPVSVHLDASHPSFQFYHSGIYYEPSCSSYNLDHTAVVVGYGSEQGVDYWIVKNSWGTQWGEEGYIRMSRNKDNNCGIATSSCYPTV